MASFCVYGLGATGQSVINYFNRKKNFADYYVWDDDLAKRSFFGSHIDKKKRKRNFFKKK